MKILAAPTVSSKFLLLPTILALFFSSNLVYPQESGDRTSSPYFFVMSNDTSIDQMPLKSTSADVRITGIIANVTVKQTYCNEGDSVLEAIYVFPASTKAAVHYMQMSVGYRILIAQIKEKEEAREIYEEAKEEGKTVTLLEEERPNVFKMSVGNILPGDTIEVEMRYTELLVPVDGEYEFVYPTVVGPRYVSPSEDGESWTETPYQHEGEDPLYDFHIDLCLNAGMKIKAIGSPSHPELIFTGDTDESKYVSADLPGNKDVVVKYRLAGAQIESGLLTYEGQDENFFLAMFQPPKNPQDYQVPSREYVFIMDVSGSMSGFPLEVSKAILRDLVGGLRNQDRFNLIFFAGRSYTLAESSLSATSENIEMALSAIDKKLGGGGTEILKALKTALSLPGTEDFARTFVIVTDGYVSVERESFELIRNNLGNANFFAFGIGSSCNRYIIEGIAHVGMGEPFVVLDQTEADATGDRFRKYIEYPVLTNIDVGFTGFQVYDVEPPNVPDVFAERPVILFGKYHGEPKGTLDISGLSGNQNYSESLPVADYPADTSNSALRYLWARHKIQLLDDYGRLGGWGSDYYYTDSITKEEITELGLKYNLLTRFTSFVAVDSMVRADSGQAVSVKQPLPLPEGVSDYAIGESGRGFTNSGGWNPTSGTYATNVKFATRDRVPEGSVIQHAFPNPFSSHTSIRIYIDEMDADKSLVVRLYNSMGQLVDLIEFNDLAGGWNEVEMDFRHNYPDLPSGIYSAVLVVENRLTEPLKLLFIKR